MTALDVLLLKLLVTDLGHLSSPFKLLQPITCHELLSRSKCREQKREGDLAGAVIPACSPLSEPCCKKHLCSQAVTGTGRHMELSTQNSVPHTWRRLLNPTSRLILHSFKHPRLTVQPSLSCPCSLKQGANAEGRHLTLPCFICSTDEARRERCSILPFLTLGCYWTHKNNYPCMTQHPFAPSSVDSSPFWAMTMTAMLCGNKKKNYKT